MGERLQPEVADRSRDERIRAAVGYLRRHPRALLILDNVAEPADLNRPVTQDLVPAGLPCRVLFTTRRRDLDLDTDFCSMCGREWCAMRISQEVKETLAGDD